MTNIAAALFYTHSADPISGVIFSCKASQLHFKTAARLLVHNKQKTHPRTEPALLCPDKRRLRGARLT